MDQETLKSRWANLAVVHGMNVRPGDVVVVQASTEMLPEARIMVEAAYKAGAGFVYPLLVDNWMELSQLKHGLPEYTGCVPSIYANLWNELVDLKGCSVRIEQLEDPEILSQGDAKRRAQIMSARMGARKKFYDFGITGGVRWNILPASTPKWAASIFPNLSADEATTKLWETLGGLLRLDRDDYLEFWLQHAARLKARGDKLNTMRIRELHFTGPEAPGRTKTDLRIALHDLNRFKAAAMESVVGTTFFANLPTEEVWTTPYFPGTRGEAYVTRPVLLGSQLVEGLWVKFGDDGGVVDSYAEKGHDSFLAMIEVDPRARFLGEIALVGADSPIFQSGLVFGTILLDENAACHMAFGRAYTTNIEGGTEMSAEQLLEVGCNSATTHRDVMISDETVSVDATLADGTTIRLIDQGHWVGEFAV